MRIPIEPLNPLDKLTPPETDVAQVDPVIALRRVNPNLPRFQGSDGTPAERPEASADVLPAAADYLGEDRRQGERRGDDKASLLDTRVRRDRRRQMAKPKIDLKV